MQVSEAEDTYSQIIIPGLIYNIGTGFTLSDYIILFDETEHVFVYGSRSGQTSFKVIEEFESTNLGSYVPVWGTPNRNVNNPFVIMSDGSNFRALMLQAPQNAGEAVAFRIVSDLNIPAGQMDEHSDFY